MILEFWNVFRDPNSTAEEKKLAVKRIHHEKGDELLRFGIQIYNDKNNGQQIFQPKDILQSAYMRLLITNSTSGLPSLNSDGEVMKYFKNTMKNLFLNYLQPKKNSPIEPITDQEFQSDIEYIDDFKSFEIRDKIKNFGRVNRVCLDLLERKSSGYTFVELVSSFTEYNSFNVNELNRKYDNCKKAFKKYFR
jgi:hypothetical protein